MKRIFTHLFVSVLLMLSATSWAQTALVHGKVYHIQNAHFTDRAVTAVDGQIAKLGNAVTNKSDVKQQWYVIADGSKYLFRNVYNGQYLSQTAQNGWGLTATRDADSNKFEYIVAGEVHNTIRSTSVSNNSNGYMHLGSENGNIQGWGSGSGGTQWDFTLIDYTNEQLDALFDNFISEETIRLSLSAIFSDAACTVLNDEYASMSLENIKADANYIALPAALQKTVLKIKNGNWYEENADNTKEGWENKYAKKFRVQMYEPYSIADNEGIIGFMRFNSHANNDNPTGIYMHEAGNLYVMVEGEIEPGATLRLVDAGANDRIIYPTGKGYELKTGLNVLTFTEPGGHFYICYNVETYNPSTKEFKYKLSDFEPLKIHIEGGAITGFYNAQGDFRAKADDGSDDLWKTITGASVDCDEDWVYMEKRANLSVVPVLGHRQILLFSLNTTDEGDKGMEYYLPEKINIPTTPYNRTGKWSDFGLGIPDEGYDGYKVNIMMEAWDRIMYSELATMGLLSKDDMDKMNDLYPRWNADGTRGEIYDFNNVSAVDGKTYQEFCDGRDYSEYFNHHGVALGVGGNTYMYGSGDHCGYHHNTMGGIIQDIAYSAGSTWGPAHEIGHQHQDTYLLNGQTEVTNNLFANVALWYKGLSTSRYNGSNGSLESVLNAFNTENSDTYTNNIWALTHLYYRLWLYYHLAGNNTQFWPRLYELLRVDPLQNGGTISGDKSLLLFYKHACVAAGEDLTEFFRAHGFLSVMDNRLVGDYANATYNVTQDMIDEAIAEVKAMRDSNGNPLKENLAILFICDDEVGSTVDNIKYSTTYRHDGKTLREVYGETTPNSDFGSVNDFISGNVATTAYTATLNSDGTITMSDGQGGVGFLVFNEKGELISFSNKATFKLSDEALEAIVSGKATITTVDTESNVTTAEVDITAMQKGVLEQLIAKAQPIVDMIDNTYTKIGYFKGAAVADLASALAYAKEVYDGSSGYEAAYDLLYAEYTKVLANTDSKIPFNPSLTYIITNYAYTSETMWVNSENTVRSEGGVDQTSNDARWKFVETSTAGVYNIRTLNDDYIPAVQQSASMTATTGQANSDALYTLEEVKDGVWAIKLSPAAGYRNLHSSWNNVVGWETGADASRWYLTAVEADPVIADLTNLEVYINKTEQLLDEVLGTVTYAKGEPLPLQTTAEGSAYYLWTNAQSAAEGPIANLVDGAANNHFHTDYTSEPPSGSHYLTVYLGEDNTLSNFTFSHTTRSGAQTDFPRSVDVYGSNDNVTYKYIGSASGMPQSAGAAWEFDGVMLSSYKYLRFNYHANRGYWHMAEFDITPVTGFTATVNDTYSSTVEVDEVTAAMNALHNGKRTANGISPTTSDVEEKLQALQSAYNTLYKKYKTTIDARKATLAALVTETETLINQVGNITIAQENKLTLTTENLYCNAPYIAQNNNDYSAAYVDKLTDGSKTTFLHTDYSGTVAAPHHLRVDLGSGSTTTKFRFNYSTRDNGNNCPTTIVIEGCDSADGTYTTITTLTTADGLPNPGQNTNGGVAADFESSVIEMSKAYRYIRFTVTKTEGNANTFFVMSEFGFAIVANEVTVYDAYKSYLAEELLLTTMFVTISSKAMSTNDLVTSVPLLDEQIADQQAAYDTLRAVEHAASSHTLVVGAAGYATLYLGNNTIIPAGVEAYIVSAVGGSSVTLTRVKDVLPACQGVIVKAAAGEYDFIRTADAATCDFADNLLKGTLVDTKVETPAYVLGLVEGEVGFYKAVTAGYADGAFLNNANKAYLPMSNTDGAASYSFRFGEGTTGVGEVEGESGNVKGEIYDLTGRRVEAVTAPGIYIVGGKKILVK